MWLYLRVSALAACAAALTVAILSPEPSSAQDDTRVKRNVDVLMCSHAWFDDGTVVHRDAEEVKACVTTYLGEGAVP